MDPLTQMILLSFQGIGLYLVGDAAYIAGAYAVLGTDAVAVLSDLTDNCGGDPVKCGAIVSQGSNCIADLKKAHDQGLLAASAQVATQDGYDLCQVVRTALGATAGGAAQQGVNQAQQQQQQQGQGQQLAKTESSSSTGWIVAGGVVVVIGGVLYYLSRGKTARAAA